MRTKICAELATGHHGDVGVALKMIQAAADAGCDAVKIQHYGAVNPTDPQAAWLNESRLTLTEICSLQGDAQALGLEFWATPFNESTLRDLADISVDRIKIASSDARAKWPLKSDARVQPPHLGVVVSWPWGEASLGDSYIGAMHLTAIPLYPTPLECVFRAPLLDGWSDHTVGLAACQHMISHGAQWIEAHLTLGEGKSRVCVWDKHVEDFRKLREYADAVETMRTGVSQVYRDRWRA
jgi:sialic acid synthase SpsE